ncbi:MAG TPA: hypothetical protein VES95_03195 [Dermatophilaceae bacterium]|nr:hypothetical protein [Dermatophilaceae bacterium]
MRRSAVVLLLGVTLLAPSATATSAASASAGPVDTAGPAHGTSQGATAATAASGTFTIAADFTTLSASPAAHGRHCTVTLQGVLTFTGTLEGGAEGSITARILAPCDQALASPPGTFRDVFRFTGGFEGAIGGVTASGALTYAGVTSPGGSIGAVIRLRGTSTAVLRADAAVGVGGSYTGVARP